MFEMKNATQKLQLHERLANAICNTIDERLTLETLFPKEFNEKNIRLFLNYIKKREGSDERDCETVFHITSSNYGDTYIQVSYSDDSIKFSNEWLIPNFWNFDYIMDYYKYHDNSLENEVGAIFTCECKHRIPRQMIDQNPFMTMSSSSPLSREITRKINTFFDIGYIDQSFLPNLKYTICPICGYISPINVNSKCENCGKIMSRSFSQNSVWDHETPSVSDDAERLYSDFSKSFVDDEIYNINRKIKKLRKKRKKLVKIAMN